VGALSFVVESGRALTITRLVVHPHHFRRGVATALLRDVEERVLQIAVFNVATARLNAAALSLYDRLGYQITRNSDTPEGITVVHLAKQK
jgi:ribosomal protein S18 acetylase RimI-like enzyme